MNMSRIKLNSALFFFLGLIIALINGCDNSFDPRGPYQKSLVVYSILSNRSDTQFVRIYTTYNPSGFDPAENTSDTYVRNAIVTLTDDSTTYRLRDTVITRVDKSRYTDDPSGYVAYPCLLRPGKSYRLTATSAQGNVLAAVDVPGTGLLIPSNPFVLLAPDKYTTEYIGVTIQISPFTRGYVVRLYIEYEVKVGSEWVRRREEIPSVAVTGSGSEVQYEYPRLTRRTTDINQPNVNIYFPISIYNAVFKRIVSQYGTDGFRLKSATYLLTQVEANLYKYFNLANGFQDQYSIRTDQPDFSNIQGGLGVFGAMTEDSVRVEF
jgi:hypothetical protein